MKIKKIRNIPIPLFFLLILLVGCGSNTKPNKPVETSKPVSIKKDIKLKGFYTCYKWEEENYDSRISFKSTESNGNSPHAVFSFDDDKITIAGSSGTELPEWYEGTYEKTNGDVYEFNVNYVCNEDYPNCSTKKKEKKDLKGSFSFSEGIMYYENNKQKKCEIGGPTYY